MKDLISAYKTKRMGGVYIIEHLRYNWVELVDNVLLKIKHLFWLSLHFNLCLFSGYSYYHLSWIITQSCIFSIILIFSIRESPTKYNHE